MKVSVKRIYEEPKKSDGTRILIDRLWPRGIQKARAAIDVWAKDLAPSNELRAWLHTDKKRRYKAFSIKYRDELATKKEQARALTKGRTSITLITSVKDLEHSHVPILVAFLKRKS